MASNETTEGFIKVPRKTSEEKTGMPRTRSQTEVENARIASLITKASEAAPPALAVYLKQATPVFQAAWAFLCLVAPHHKHECQVYGTLGHATSPRRDGRPLNAAARG